MEPYHRHYRPPPPGRKGPFSRAWARTKTAGSFLRRQFSSGGDHPNNKIAGRRLLSVTIALMIGSFFGELDRALLVTAIPRITAEFRSLDQAAWYQASHDLARLAFLPVFGRVYTLFPLKVTYCVCILVSIIGACVSLDLSLP
jgi:hypothetical protein